MKSEMQFHRKYMQKVRTTGASGTLSTYRDNYEILGVTRDATQQQIRSAYKKLALRFHPDRNASEDSKVQWAGVPEAYSVLSDPNQRLEYDSTLPTRDALEAFYLRYNPVKLDNAAIETIIENWKGKEVKMFEMLRQKYEIPAHDGVLDLDQRDMIHDERLSGEKRIQIKADHLTSSPVLCQDVGVSGFCTRLRDILCCMTRRATTFKGRYSVLPSELSDDDDD